MIDTPKTEEINTTINECFLPNKYLINRHSRQTLDTTLQVDRYASEALESIFKFLDKNHYSAITAMQGSGKTEVGYIYAFYKLKDLGFTGRIFFIFPSNIASEQKGVKYANRDSNSAGLQLDICIYNKYSSAKEKEDINKSRIINCHASRLQELAAGPEDIVIFDEAHKSFIDSYVDTESNLEHILHCRAKVIFLTATPFKEFYQAHHINELTIISKFKPKTVINFTELTQNGKQSFNVEQSLNMYAAQAEQYVKSISPDKPLVYFIFIKSIDRINQLKRLLFDKGFDIDIIYSDEELKENSKIWKGLINCGSIPVDRKPLIVFTTPVLYEAIDIKNTNIGSVAVFGESWIHNIRQIAGRFRNCSNLQIDYYLAAANKKKGYFKTFQTYREKHYSVFLRLKEIYEKIKVEVNDRIITDKFLHCYLADAKTYLYEDGSFNELSCVRSFIKEKNQWLSNKQRLQELGKYFHVTDLGPHEIKFSVKLERLAEEVKIKRKLDRSIAFEKVRENLQYALFLTSTSNSDIRLRKHSRNKLKLDVNKLVDDHEYQIWLKSINHNVRKHMYEIISRFLYLSKYMKGDVGMINIVERNYTEFKSNVEQQLSIIMILYSRNISRVDRVNRYNFLKILNSFNVDERYTPLEIKETIDYALRNYKHLKVPGKNYTHFFRMLFVAKRVKGGKYKVEQRKTLEVFCSLSHTSPLLHNNY